jgi:hypothetical protein
LFLLNIFRSVGPGSEELKTIRKLQKLYRCANNPEFTQNNQKKVEKQKEEIVEEKGKHCQFLM